MSQDKQYVLRKTLQERALVATAAALLNRPDVRNLLCEDYASGLRSDEIIRIMKDKANEILKANTLKDKFIPVVMGLRSQVLKWLKYFYFKSPNIGMPKRFHWFTDGILDKEKTAEELVSDDSINILNRYKLACIYCLEKYIPSLWEKIPVTHQKCFYYTDPACVNQHALVIFWTYAVKNELHKLLPLMMKDGRQCTVYQYAFENAAVDGNEVAAKYFWQKLNCAEKESSVNQILDCMTDINGEVDCDLYSKESCPEVFSFLLSVVDEEVQLNFFEKAGFQIMYSFLEWPWLELFYKAKQQMNPFLGDVKKTNLAKVFYEQQPLSDEGKCYNYEGIFAEFWNDISEHSRHHIIKQCIQKGLFGSREVDFECMVTNLVQRSRYTDDLLLQHLPICVCIHYAYFEQWDYLKGFINKFSLNTKSRKLKFKAFATDLAQSFHMWMPKEIKHGILATLHEVLDNILQINEESQSEDDDDSEDTESEDDNYVRPVKKRPRKAC